MFPRCYNINKECIRQGAFTRHSFWARHSKILARGPIVWARPAWFSRQNMFEFLQCWFLERHPWNKNGTLKFGSPCTYMTAVHMWFQALPACPACFCGLFKKKTLQILECKLQLYGSLLWKSENVCHNCGTKQGQPLHRSVHGLVLKHGTPERRNAGTPERRNAGTLERWNTETRNTETRNTKLLKPGTYEK